MSRIIASDLERNFNALRKTDPSQLNLDLSSYEVPDQSHAGVGSAATANWGNGFAKFASGSANVNYSQPTFFSPVHTPINWQIPSKRLEQYQWARFFYENEPKVAASIDFYSYFPMNNWVHECKDRKVTKYFDRFKKRLQLNKWCSIISREVHLLGDCFPFLEIQCPICGGTGRVGDTLCDHEDGTIKRVVILNPDYVDVYTTPMNPDPLVALRPDEELIQMVQKRTPGYEKLTPDVIRLIASGQPIKLNNEFVSHLKYGEGGYTKYGVGMVRRLFPILSYKTKLMVANWIVAERLIVPIKIVKIGSDTRPAGAADISAVQEQLQNVAQDPNLTLVTYHDFQVEWVGANSAVLQLSNEMEFISQEILDGMMINNALLNGEGPNFGSAAVGIESMIQRLESFREEMSEWIEEKIYRPEAIRQGMMDEDDADEDGDELEPIYPRVKWNPMHLRDQQQFRTFVIQLYDKGLLSGQTVLESFGFDPDKEIERRRYDSIQMMALGQQMGGGGLEGGGMGGMPPMGGDMGGGPPGMGGDMGGGPPGMGGPPIEAGGGDIGAPPALSQEKSTLDIADPSQFNGKVLKKKSRDRLIADQQKLTKSQDEQQMGVGPQPFWGSRDDQGRIVFTKPERQLLAGLQRQQEDGMLQYPIYPQYEVKIGSSTYPLDFGIPHLKIGLEADGEIFHSGEEAEQHDSERDAKLAQQGWTILRFKDKEIDQRLPQVMGQINQTVMMKENYLQKHNVEYKDKNSDLNK